MHQELLIATGRGIVLKEARSGQRCVDYLTSFKHVLIVRARQWHQQTYAAWCRKHGTHETKNQPFRCWNDEIVQRTREVLGPRWDEIIRWLGSRFDDLIAETAAVFSELHRDLEGMSFSADLAEYIPSAVNVPKARTNEQSDPFYSEHRHLAPQALGNILAGMESRQKCITDEIRNASRKIVQATQCVHDPRSAVMRMYS